MEKYHLQGCTQQRPSQYETVLLSNENITFKRFQPLNPATLTPDLPFEGEPIHNCQETISLVEKQRMI